MAIAIKSAGVRQLKNSVAKWLITLGGISVLFTLVLIFMYLLYVIKPIFESAKIEPLVNTTVTSSSKVMTTGIDELKELAYFINEEGIVDFYQVKLNTSLNASENVDGIDNTSANNQLGRKVLSQKLIEENQTLEKIIDVGIDHKILLDNSGKVQLIRPLFTASYANEQREIIPSITFPLSNEAIIVDEEAQKINQLAFAMDDEQGIFVSFTQDKRLIKTTLIAEDDFSYDPAYEILYQTIDYPIEHVDNILVAPDLSMAFVRSADQVFVFDLTDEYSVELKTIIEPNKISNVNKENGDVHITSMALLSGGSSLLLGNSQGQVSQWFEISTPQGREFTQVRVFEVSDSEAVEKIYT